MIIGLIGRGSADLIAPLRAGDRAYQIMEMSISYTEMISRCPACRQSPISITEWVSIRPYIRFHCVSCRQPLRLTMIGGLARVLYFVSWPAALLMLLYIQVEIDQGRFIARASFGNVVAGFVSAAFFAVAFVATKAMAFVAPRG